MLAYVKFFSLAILFASAMLIAIVSCRPHNTAALRPAVDLRSRDEIKVAMRNAGCFGPTVSTDQWGVETETWQLNKGRLHYLYRFDYYGPKVIYEASSTQYH